MALPEHIDDHPLAIHLREVHVVDAPLGSQLHGRGLIQHVVNINGFRSVFPSLL